MPSEHESAPSLQHLLIFLAELAQLWVLEASLGKGVIYTANVLARVQNAICQL